MNKKFISVFMMGAATLAPLSTLVSCSDYDDDINNLQAQIDASGVNLKEEVSKLQKLLDECKAAAEKADADLEQAIKNATNDAKGYADIQAEQAKQAAIAALQAQLSQAIADLENGAIADAKARAEQAYNLAEQTSKVASSNKAELEKLAKELEKVNADLTKAIEALQSRMTAAEAEIAAVKAKAAKNEADLTTLNTTVEALKTSNETAHKALSDKDDELAALIAANKTEIEGKLSAEVAALNTKIGEINTAISALEGRVAKNELDITGIKQEIANTINPKLQSLSTDLEQAKTEIQNINKYLEILNQNLNNLITGLIFQDEQLEMVQAQVVSGYDANKTGISDITCYENNGSTVVFPYTKAAVKSRLTAGHWNIEKIIGNVYYTINPTDVNFTDKANIGLENSNSLNAKDKGITISDPVAANRQAPIKRSADAPANGLYQSTLTNGNYDLTSSHNGFDKVNSFALFTSYQQKDKDGNVATKKVYSEYALNINVTDAAEQTAPAMAAIDPDATHPAGVDARYLAAYDDKMMIGEFTLLPTLDEFGKAGQGGSKVYQKYVEIYKVFNSRGTEVTNSAKSAIDKENTGVLNTILTEKNENFNQITVKIPESYNNTTLSGSTVWFRYFIQNYNGTIYCTTYRVMFAKKLIADGKVTIKHSPYRAGVNDTKVYWEQDDKGAFKTVDIKDLTVEKKTEFAEQAICITDAASNKLWCSNTNKIKIEAVQDANGDYLKLTDVSFWKGNSSNGSWANESVAANRVTAIDMSYGTEATSPALNSTQMATIKNMTLKYKPEDLIVGKEYELKMTSLDANDNVVGEMKIYFTMTYSGHHNSMVKPNPYYFMPYNPESPLTTLDDMRKQTYTLTAWAAKVASSVPDVYNAYYNIGQVFNTPHSLADGCVLSFDLADKDTYVVGGANHAYNPIHDFISINGTRMNGPSYRLEVPAAALKKNEEHTYGIELAVEEFGVTSLWYNPVKFNVVFKSVIAHADIIFDKTSYEVGYPSQKLVINDGNITAGDKSHSDNPDMLLFGTGRDDRIKDLKVELVDQSAASLFKNTSVELDNKGNEHIYVPISDAGIEIETQEIQGEDIGAITSAPIKFKLLVTDFFGNTNSKEFAVKVKKNQN